MHEFGNDSLGLIAAAIETAHPEDRVSVEYPGYINILTPNGSLHVLGDANETWGFDIYTDEGDLSSIAGYCDLAIERDSEDVEAIAAAYTRELFQWKNVRMYAAVAEATAKFFTSIAAAYPEIKTGNFPPDADQAFADAATAAAQTWLAVNTSA